MAFIRRDDGLVPKGMVISARQHHKIWDLLDDMVDAKPPPRLRGIIDQLRETTGLPRVWTTPDAR